MYTATYSPEDNKLRLSASSRLDQPTYERVKAAGFIWAAKQEVFVAPMWTPSREDFLLELCDEIGDEDTSLVDRAHDRAERFTGYKEKRAAEAGHARDYVHRITDGIPMGQPILVGHHSEKHARRDQQRIENGLRKAVNLWETSQYWKSRAAGAIAHAKYKERPDVRARRIKRIEADKRKQEREIEQAQTLLTAWSRLEAPSSKTGTEATVELIRKRADYLAGHSHQYRCFPLSEYPRAEDVSQYEGEMSIGTALDRGIITPHQARDFITPGLTAVIAWGQRWTDHFDNRLAYEKAMLDEQGASDLLLPPPRPKQLPLCNYLAPEGIDIANIYNRGELLHYPQKQMTQAEYAAINVDYKGTRVVGRSHRVRIAMIRHELFCVFLTDSKSHAIPDSVAASPAPPPRLATPTYKQPEPTEFDAMKETLKSGVSTVVAPQLFPTPPTLAARMVKLANVGPGDRVLEPSAGTGRIIDALGGTDAQNHIVAIELNNSLASGLLRRYSPRVEVIQGDFLEPMAIGTFDAIVMNPPFVNAQDVEHIKRAAELLNDGGRLVALCANGPRQQEQLQPWLETFGGTYEALPAGSFINAGTNVNVAMVTLTRYH